MPHTIRFRCIVCKHTEMVNIPTWKGKRFVCPNQCGAVYMLWYDSEDKKWRWNTLIRPIYKKR